jgi:hypothetical protein
MTLRRREWPAPTNTVEIVELSILYDGRLIDLVVVDYPGEDFTQALRKLETDRIGRLYEHYCKADFFLLLFDPEVDVRGFDAAGPEQREQRIRRQDAFLQAIREIYLEQAGKNAARLRQIDVGVVLTKADEHPELQSAGSSKAFFKKYASPLLQKIRRQAAAVRVFPLSAVGAVQPVSGNGEARRVPAAQLEPRGYEPILEWIIGRRDWRRRKPWIAGTAMIISVLLIALGFLIAWDWIGERHRLTTLADPNRTAIQKLQDTAGSHSWFFSGATRHRFALIDERIEQIKSLAGRAANEGILTDLEKEVKTLLELRPGISAAKLERLQSDVIERREGIRFEQVQSLYERDHPLFLREADRFVEDFPAGRNRDRVKVMIDAWGDKERRAFRQFVRGIVIANADSALQKAQHIRAYLKSYEKKDHDSERIRRAADLAVQFAQPVTYRVKLKTSGELDVPRYHRVIVVREGEEIRKFTSPDASTRINWDDASFQMEWKVGQPLRLELWESRHFYRITDSKIAQLDDNQPLSIQIFAPETVLEPLPDWRAYVSEVFVRFEVEGLAKDDWQIIRDYLAPGDRW